MGLNIKDLTAHEKKLTDIIEHAQKEREAIRLLIAGMRLRAENTGEQETITPAPQSAKTPTIRQAIKKIIDDANGDWIMTKEVLDKLFEMGIRNRKQIKGLRPTVSTWLRKFYDMGELERENVGDPNSPKFKYRKRKDSTLV
jgi:hypothetical protein